MEFPIFRKGIFAMKNDYQSIGFKKLLNKLQQESWQLELIISGFAIYGLITGYDSIMVMYLKAMKSSELLGAGLLNIILNCMSILVTLLLVHVVIRGIWIGAIGLRYVSGDIDYDHLNYSEKFTSFLKKRVGSFDRYILRLENICSTLFALAFLMIFFFISFFAIAGIFALVENYLQRIASYSENLYAVLHLGFIIPYFFCVALVFIDFIGAGILKKHQHISRIYFPIYRIFGFLTLAFLYRPLLYNFLDQKKAR